MLEYTNNKQWLIAAVEPLIRKQDPSTRIILQAISLTSGVHVGPGTWGVAFLPGRLDRETAAPRGERSYDA